jgi:hypothetical protein
MFTSVCAFGTRLRLSSTAGTRKGGTPESPAPRCADLQSAYALFAYFFLPRPLPPPVSGVTEQTPPLTGLATN